MGHVFMLMVPRGKGAPLKAIRAHAEKSNFVAREFEEPITHANEFHPRASLMSANSRLRHAVIHYYTYEPKVKPESFAGEPRMII